MWVLHRRKEIVGLHHFNVTLSLGLFTRDVFRPIIARSWSMLLQYKMYCAVVSFLRHRCAGQAWGYQLG